MMSETNSKYTSSNPNESEESKEAPSELDNIKTVCLAAIEHHFTLQTPTNN
jgi:hypothetical protein